MNLHLSLETNDESLKLICYIGPESAPGTATDRDRARNVTSALEPGRGDQGEDDRGDEESGGSPLQASRGFGQLWPKLCSARQDLSTMKPRFWTKFETDTILESSNSVWGLTAAAAAVPALVASSVALSEEEEEEQKTLSS